MWFSSFEKYANFRSMSDEHKLAFLPVVLKDAASDWFDMLSDETRSNWEQLRTKFKERFQDSDVMRWQKASKLWGRDQGQHESVDDRSIVFAIWHLHRPPCRHTAQIDPSYSLAGTWTDHADTLWHRLHQVLQ